MHPSAGRRGREWRGSEMFSFFRALSTRLWVWSLKFEVGSVNEWCRCRGRARFGNGVELNKILLVACCLLLARLIACIYGYFLSWCFFSLCVTVFIQFAMSNLMTVLQTLPTVPYIMTYLVLYRTWYVHKLILSCVCLFVCLFPAFFLWLICLEEVGRKHHWKGYYIALYLYCE